MTVFLNVSGFLTDNYGSTSTCKVGMGWNIVSYTYYLHSFEATIISNYSQTCSETVSRTTPSFVPYYFGFGATIVRYQYITPVNVKP